MTLGGAESLLNSNFAGDMKHVIQKNIEPAELQLQMPNQTDLQNFNSEIGNLQGMTSSVDNRISDAHSLQMNGIDLTAADNTQYLGTNLIDSKIKNPGDRILEAFKDFHKQSLQISSDVSAKLEAMSANTNLNSKDIIELQTLVSRYGILHDLTSKVADKVSQGLQTLFRNQG